jgi:hypothetical protein
MDRATAGQIICGLGGGLACFAVSYMRDELDRAEELRQREKTKRRILRKSNKRLQRGQQAPAGLVGSGLSRVTSAAARRTAQVVTGQIREKLAQLGRDDDWGAAFQHLDRDGNGDLTASEFREGIRSLTGTWLTPSDLEELMYEVDRNGDERVNCELPLAPVGPLMQLPPL